MHYSPLALECLILYSLGTAVITLFNLRVSLDYEYKKYLLASAASSIGSVLFSLILILTLFRSHRDIGRIYATSFVYFIIGVVLLITFFRKSRPNIDKEHLSFAYKYSLPFVPHGISQVLLAQVDRIMIRSYVGDAAAGIYSLAGNVRLVMTIIETSVMTAWRTWFFKTMETEDTKRIQRTATILTAGYAILVTGVMAFAREIILVVGDKGYESARFVVTPMVADAFMLFIYGIVVQGEAYRKKTNYIMIGTLIATAINLVTNYIFIRLYGFIAAAYTTLFSYVVYLVLHVIVSRRVTGFYILPLKAMLTLIGVVTVSFVLNTLLMDIWWLRIPIGLMFPAGLLVYLLKQPETANLLASKIKRFSRRG